MPFRPVLRLLLLALLPAGLAAQTDNVVNSKHNMSARAAANPTQLTNYGEVCVYCHTPHGGSNSTNAPCGTATSGRRPAPTRCTTTPGAPRST